MAGDLVRLGVRIEATGEQQVVVPTAAGITDQMNRRAAGGRPDNGNHGPVRERVR